MSVIGRETVYGYELALKLQDDGLPVSEGSIYPLLLRLQKEKLIYGEMKKSPSGPNRKYYYLTDDGKTALQSFKDYWHDIKMSVDQLLEMGDDNEYR